MPTGMATLDLRALTEWHAVVGYLGLALILAAYILIEGWKQKRRAGAYLALNLAGSGLVLLSLFFRPNLPSVILEGIWFAVSLVFLIRFLDRRRAAHHEGGPEAPRE